VNAKADAFLVSPGYGRSYGDGQRRIRHGLPSLGLACINGLLKSNGYRTRFIDLACSDWTEPGLIGCVAAERPRFVGITAVTTQIMSAVRIAQAVKRASPRTATVLGGPHPSALPDLTASYPGVDYVVSGEGERPMLDLLEGRKAAEIAGLTWTEDGTVRSNPRRPPIMDLDSMPLPDYEGLNIERYGHILNGTLMPVMSGRGCPYHCVFCVSDAVSGNKCRFLSPARFVDHIEDLLVRYGVRRFTFTDETFVLKAARVRGICDEILRRNLRIRWVCQTRVNGIEPEIVAIMKRAGCQAMEIGIESGDPDVLNRVGKGIEPDQVRSACRTIRKAGIRLNGFFILGLPYDTPQTVRRTIDFAKELPLDFAQFAMFVPLPGSEGWNLALDGQVLRLYASNWDDFSRYTYPIVESDALSREQLKTLHAAALREFYFRPKMAARWLLGIRSARALRNLFDMVLGFARIATAKRLPTEAVPTTEVTPENMGGLIGMLGKTKPSQIRRPVRRPEPEPAVTVC